MSGLEIAGVVLAVAPLVIAALESYKTGIHAVQRLYYWDSQLLRLILSLKVQHAKFKLNLEKLLRAAAPDQNIQQVPEDYNSVLWRGPTAIRVKAYLSTGHEAFKLTIEDYESCVKRIAYKLRHVNRPKLAAKDDLKALIDANTTVDGRYSWVKKVDFTMKHREVVDMIARLDQSNLTLSGFISDGDMLDRLQTQHADSMQTVNLASRLHAIRRHAESLHEALVAARLPDCPESHHVALHLDDRLLQSNAIASTKEDLKFKISVCIDLSSSPQWYQTLITVGKPQSSSQLPMDDICHLTKEIEQVEHSFHLLNDAISKAKRVPLPSHSRILDTNATTLACLLDSQAALTPKDTTILALSLASSLVQLSATGWYEEHWTKNNITIFRLRENSGCLTPCISKSFLSSTAMPSSRNIKAVESLFELGILLMEIGCQRSFESWLSERGFRCIDNSRFAKLSFALQWHEEGDGLLPIKYRVVIAKCLKCSFDEYDVKWEDPNFRQAVCRDIIEPLHQNASIW